MRNGNIKKKIYDKLDLCADVIKYFTADLELPVEELMARYGRKEGTSASKELNRTYRMIKGYYNTYDYHGQLSKKRAELKVKYLQAFYALSEFEYKENCKKNNQPIDQSYCDQLAVVAEQIIKEANKELEEAIKRADEITARKIEKYFKNIEQEEQEPEKDWDINDAPSNEIDWNEVDYFDYINQKEDETNPE